MWCIGVSKRQGLEEKDHRRHLRLTKKEADGCRHRGGSDGQGQGRESGEPPRVLRRVDHLSRATAGCRHSSLGGDQISRDRKPVSCVAGPPRGASTGNDVPLESSWSDSSTTMPWELALIHRCCFQESCHDPRLNQHRSRGPSSHLRLAASCPMGLCQCRDPLKESGLRRSRAVRFELRLIAKGFIRAAPACP